MHGKVDDRKPKKFGRLEGNLESYKKEDRKEKSFKKFRKVSKKVRDREEGASNRDRRPSAPLESSSTISRCTRQPKKVCVKKKVSETFSVSVWLSVARHKRLAASTSSNLAKLVFAVLFVFVLLSGDHSVSDAGGLSASDEQFGWFVNRKLWCSEGSDACEVSALRFRA